jgi:hypothetical protein
VRRGERQTHATAHLTPIGVMIWPIALTVREAIQHILMPRSTDAITADCQYHAHPDSEDKRPVYQSKFIDSFLRNVADGCFGRERDQREKDSSYQCAKGVSAFGDKCDGG